ncbi:MAG: ATP-binding protein [Phyllobacteriaceae bacterium]|nr:ATP-binding protein [Phyllobacteriaceae bacterium]
MLSESFSPVNAPEGAAAHAAPGDAVHPFPRNRTEGCVIECDGERAVISAIAGKSVTASEDYWAVGQLISVRVGENRIVGLVYKIDAATQNWDRNADNIVHVHIELVGEIRNDDKGQPRFSGGIAAYPHAGAAAHRIRAADLAAIYAASADNAVQIGQLSQDRSIPALISIDKLLSRHFAVVGTTGVGKSTAVTLLLRKIIAARKDVRVLLFDPHNEFTAAFPSEAITVDAASVDLPFWLFKLDEFVEVIYRGRKPDPAEIDALRDLIPVARERFRRGEGGMSPLLRRDRVTTALTADTPVPYRMVDLLALIEERIGQLEGKADRPALKALKARLESILADPRFQFMFGAKTVSDVFADVVSLVFRLPQEGKPICVFEMSGLPSDVVNAVVSVLSRMAFDLAVSSDGAIQTLVVCEEAHRYIPADQSVGFLPTRQAIARIAKEGRKYGVYLGVITQRPGELDQTILSQCNTIFAMRLGNERDQDIIRSAISGGAKSTLSFLSSIANRECIAFGEAFHAPMRMIFETIRAEALPGSHIYEQQEKARSGAIVAPIESVIRRIRYGHDAESVADDMPVEAPAPPPVREDFRAPPQPDGRFVSPQPQEGRFAGHQQPDSRFASQQSPLHRAEPQPSQGETRSLSPRPDLLRKDPPAADRGSDLIRGFRINRP